MLRYPFGTDIQRLQPLVMLGDGLYIKSREGRGEASLVTAGGVVHPLRRLCGERTLAEHCRRLNRRELGRMAAAELWKRRVARLTDPLAYFVEFVAPEFLRRDWMDGEIGREPEQAQAGIFARLARIAEDYPVPECPVPALFSLGRVWLLAGAAPAGGCVQVRMGREALGLTGEYLTMRTLADEWQAAVRGYLAESARELVAELAPGDPAALAAAREQMARTGAVEAGDLLFLGGERPRLGHIIPPHYNLTFGCHSGRDMAITAGLEMPPAIPSDSGLGLYRRSGARWETAAPPHGFCLGVRNTPAGFSDPGLALAAHLRWAANRIADNGCFHEHDGQEDYS